MTLGAIIFTQIGMIVNSRKSRGSIFQVKHFANRIISLGIVLEICSLYYPVLCTSFPHAI